MDNIDINTNTSTNLNQEVIDKITETVKSEVDQKITSIPVQTLTVVSPKTPPAVFIVQMTLILIAGISAMSDKLISLPFIPAKIAQFWPLFALMIPTFNSIMKKAGDYFDNGKLDDSFKD